MRRLGAIALAAALVVGLISGCRPDPPHPPPEPPPIHFPDRDPFPVPGSTAELGTRAAHATEEGKSDPVEREAICFAYEEFYDPSTFELRLPSVEEFVQDVFERVRPRSEEEQLAGKVENAYDLVRNVGNFEIQALAEQLAC